MRVGLAVPQIGRFADPAATRAVAVEAEAAGFSALWALDRLLAPVNPRTPYPASPDGELPDEQYRVLDPIGVLTLAAAVTERIRVGTSVLVGPWYPPVLLARALTTLDQISAGRLTVGLGNGWSADEYAAVGQPQQHLGARSEELLDVLAAIWTEDPVNYWGKWVTLAPSTVQPKPVQRSGPPILLAAYTPGALDRVARRGDGWMPAGVPLDALADMWTTVRGMAAQYGRDPDRLELVVRANVKLTDRPLGPDRPPFWGRADQIADDVDATRRLGADEIVVDLQGCPVDATGYCSLARELVEPARERVEPVALPVGGPVPPRA